MQCYYCGSHVPHAARICPACGRGKSRLSYLHSCGVAGGVAGSLIGFTAYSVGGALAVGLAGILAAELIAWIVLRSRRTNRIFSSNSVSVGTPINGGTPWQVQNGSEKC
jgi:hypothetical protein